MGKTAKDSRKYKDYDKEEFKRFKKNKVNQRKSNRNENDRYSSDNDID